MTQEKLPHRKELCLQSEQIVKYLLSFCFIPKKGSIMEEFKLYRISDEYVEWLREDFPNVYSSKVNARS